jgi:hypothetical protein
MNLENGMTTQSENAILWIEKLLAAKKDGVKQLIGMLGNQGDGFCCLGYGCSVTGTDYSHRETGSKAFAAKTGLINRLGETTSGLDHYDLYYLNDSEGWGFARIAKRLQKYPHQYFLPEVAKSIKEHFA